MPTTTYNTLEDLQARKDQLQRDISQSAEQIAGLWRELAAPRPSSSKGELVANLVGNGITAIDAFLLVRKLMKSYGFLFGKRRKKRS